jgi:UDP-N-acetylmuramoyl-L-alanyl-D-glutamate--2,6-diaminopimelate ligase
MKLSELLAGVALREMLAPALANQEVTGLEYDSRRVEKGFVFFAFPGSRVDGRRFAQNALELGALAVVSDLPRLRTSDSRLDSKSNMADSLAAASANFYHHPDERVLFTGITGPTVKPPPLSDRDDPAGGRQDHRLLGTIEYRLAGKSGRRRTRLLSPWT